MAPRLRLRPAWISRGLEPLAPLPLPLPVPLPSSMLSALVLAIQLLFWATPMLTEAPFLPRVAARLPPSVLAWPTLESVLE